MPSSSILPDPLTRLLLIASAIDGAAVLSANLGTGLRALFSAVFKKGGGSQIRILVSSMLTRWLTLALVAATWRAADSCTCAPEHPQAHYCRSDFVIVGRVQKLFRGNDSYDAYKVKIRNIYKTTPKAAVALRSGRILTPPQESLCGVSLQPRETYVITGHVLHLQAHIDLCGYINKWRDVTPRQRKGFRLLYKQGCTCKVHVTRRRTKSPNTCVTNYEDCFERHGVCLHDRERRCRWTRAPALTRCLQKSHFNSTMT